MGTAIWASGASRRTIEIYHQSGSSVSYPSIATVIDLLAERSIEDARTAVRTLPHGLGYDNVNISTSLFVEQTANTPSKVQSGSFPVIYELRNAHPDHMKLEPIISRLRDSSPLKMTALRPRKEARESYITQSSINVAKPLVKYVQGFDYVKDHLSLKHPERRTLPKGHKTKFYCLRANTIEEASVMGNLLVHDNIYRDQLQIDLEDRILNEQAIPTINDQLTNSRIRGAQALRAQDVSPYERRLVFQVSIGLFHLVMNFIWVLLHNHRGTIDDLGSLSYFFVILEKTRLGADHPDYHTLLSALTQILEGLLLNAWRTECGVESLEEYAKSKPGADEILQKACIILKKYATPECKQEYAGNPPKNPKISSKSDNVHANIVLLTRDLLYVVELINAISSGDFGRIEDILPDLACMFRGAGSNNYSMEILHLLFNIQEIWTPEFA